jgi:hypothetical protein
MYKGDEMKRPNNSHSWLAGGLVALFLGTIWIESVHAIPTFARKYRTSCSTCHIAIPKRNSFGEAFRRNGYRMPVDDEVAVKENPVSLGSEAWKQVWPKAIWPGSLPAALPVSAYVQMRAIHEEEKPGDDVNEWQFDMPHEVELLFGGTFGESLGFFGEWILFQDGKTGNDRFGAFHIQYSDLLGEDIFNVKMGRYEVGTSGYNAPKDDNRLTLSHILPIDYKVVPSSDKVLGESIDYRWRYRDKQSGMEVNGILFDRFEYIAGIVNGNNRVLDGDEEKDWHYRFSYKLFGETMTMKNAPEGLRTSDNWRDDSVTIGTHGYFGDTQLSTDTLTWGNEFERFGVDVRVKYDRLDVSAVAIWGEDDDPGGPRGLALINDVDSSSWSVEATYIVFPWLLPNVRYETYSCDQGFCSEQEIWNFNVSALSAANIRWVAEYWYYPDDDEGRDRLTLNMQWAF